MGRLLGVIQMGRGQGKFVGRLDVQKYKIGLALPLVSHFDLALPLSKPEIYRGVGSKKEILTPKNNLETPPGPLGGHF